MKNLNKMIDELVKDFCQIAPMPKSLVMKKLRELVETALAECRPKYKELPHRPEDFETEKEGVLSNELLRNTTKTFENIRASEYNYPYNKCLSDYDEKVKQFLKQYEEDQKIAEEGLDNDGYRRRVGI